MGNFNLVSQIKLFFQCATKESLLPNPISLSYFYRIVKQRTIKRLKSGERGRERDGPSGKFSLTVPELPVDEVVKFKIFLEQKNLSSPSFNWKIEICYWVYRIEKAATARFQLSSQKSRLSKDDKTQWGEIQSKNNFPKRKFSVEWRESHENNTFQRYVVISHKCFVGSTSSLPFADDHKI